MPIFDKPFNAEENRSEHQPGEYADDPIIPEGYYPALLTGTKEAEDGRWFLYKWQITGGGAKDTKVSVFENTTHRDGGEKAKQADRIFRGRLANYCDATGLKTVVDESELLNRPVKAYFKPWARQDGTKSNQVTHYKPIGDTTAAVSTKKPFYPTGGAPSKGQVAAQNEWNQAAADAEDAAAATGGASDLDDEIPW